MPGDPLHQCFEDDWFLGYLSGQLISMYVGGKVIEATAPVLGDLALTTLSRSDFIYGILERYPRLGVVGEARMAIWDYAGSFGITESEEMTATGATVVRQVEFVDCMEVMSPGEKLCEYRKSATR